MVMGFTMDKSVIRILRNSEIRSEYELTLRKHFTGDLDSWDTCAIRILRNNKILSNVE